MYNMTRGLYGIRKDGVEYITDVWYQLSSGKYAHLS